MNTHEIIVKQINEVADKHGVFDVTIFKQHNKIIQVLLTLPKREKQNSDLNKDMIQLDFVNKFYDVVFKAGTKDALFSTQSFVFSVKYKFFNFDLNTDKLHGLFLQLILSHNIYTKRDFINSTVEYIVHMSKHAHICESFEKKRLRNIKLKYIKYAYLNGYVDSVFEQKSDTDTLVLFNIGKHSMHLRKIHVDFITSPIPKLDIIYTSVGKDFSNPNLDYEKYSEIFLNINNKSLFENAEIYE